jgi:hypothetical protein
MSLREMEMEIEEVKETLRRRKPRRTGSLPFMMTLLCFTGSVAEGFAAYDCSNRSNIVESYPLLEPDVCANMGKGGGSRDYGVWRDCTN